MIEDVNGFVIGQYTRKVCLVSPIGRIQKTGNIELNDNPVAWAENELNIIKSEKTGTGKPLSDYPDIFESIYGKGKWSIRIYD